MGSGNTPREYPGQELTHDRDRGYKWSPHCRSLRSRLLYAMDRGTCTLLLPALLVLLGRQARGETPATITRLLLFNTASTISPEGDMLFPLNTNHTSEIVCEVAEGATPKWQLETAQITAPYDGVNTTTKGNVSSIFLTEQGLIPYMKNSTSGMVTVMCLEMHNNPGWNR